MEKKSCTFEVFRNCVYLKKIRAKSFEEAKGALIKHIKESKSADYFEIRHNGKLVPII